MNKSLRMLWMRLSFVALILASGLMTQPLHASELKQKESVVHVEWNATSQKDVQNLLQELKGLGAQGFEDEAADPYADVPVTASWTSEEMSARDLVQWMRSQAQQEVVAGLCITFKITIKIFGWKIGTIPVRICIDL